MPVRIWSLIIAASVFALDRVTKILVERNISMWDSHNVIPGFFDLIHTKNRGAAFGMFGDGNSEWRSFVLVGVSIAVLLLISMALLKPGRSGFAASRLTTVALSLVMGGAAGNIYDRLVYGMVTDFLDFYVGSYHFAAFNIADSAITTGACLLLLDMWRGRHQTVTTDAS